MPLYQIRGLDGNIYQIEGPPGVTKEQIKKKILERAPQAGVPPQEENTLEKVPLVGDAAAWLADIPLAACMHRCDRKRQASRRCCRRKP